MYSICWIDAEGCNLICVFEILYSRIDNKFTSASRQQILYVQLSHGIPP